MPRVPFRISQSPVGSTNPAAPGRAAPAYSTRSLGPSQQREQFADRALNRLQTAINQAVSVVKSLPFADGNYLANVSMVQGANTLQHGLGRAWQGYMVVNVQGGLVASMATFAAAHDATTPALDAGVIVITSTAACAASVWVW